MISSRQARALLAQDMRLGWVLIKVSAKVIMLATKISLYVLIMVTYMINQRWLPATLRSAVRKYLQAHWLLFLQSFTREGAVRYLFC